MELELKKVTEDINKAVEEIRTETKASKEAAGKMEANLASLLETKSALEARLSALETAAARPGFVGKSNGKPDEYKAAFDNYIRNASDNDAIREMKAVSVSGGTPAGSKGGFAVPEMIARDILRVAEDVSTFANLTRVVQISTPDYVELIDLGGTGVEWLGSETATRNEQETATLAEIRPVMGTMSANLRASQDSLDDMFFNVDAWLAEGLGRKFGQESNKVWLSGDGVRKPAGLLTSTTVGAVNTGAAATLGTDPYAKLIDIVYTLKSEYRSQASWMMSSTTIAALAKIKDTTGNFILSPSVAGGVPSTLLGYAVNTEEGVPSVAAGQIVATFGDYKRAYLATVRQDIRLQVNPFKIGQGTVLFEADKRIGGAVADPNAVKFLKVAA